MAPAEAPKFEYLCIILDKPGTNAKRMEYRSIHIQGLRPLMESQTLISGGLFPLPFPTSTIMKIIDARSNHKYCLLTTLWLGTMFNTHPTDSETPPFKGSMVVIQATSAQEAREIVGRDIYAQNGVWDFENAQIFPPAMALGLIQNLLNFSNQDVIPFTWIIGLALIVIFSLAYVRDPFKGIPGPFLARWTAWWNVYYSRKGNMHRNMMAMHKKYGTLVRTGPNEVSTSNPEAFNIIYGAGTGFRKSDWYSVWQGTRKWDLFGERNTEIHRNQRRLVANTYSLSNMKKLEPYVDSAIGVFITKMAEMSGQQVDISYWTHLFGFDVIGEVTFSKRFGFMESGKDDGAFAIIENSLRSAAWSGYVPWLYWLNARLTPVIGNHLAVTARQGSLLKMAATAIAERKERGSSHADVLAQFFDIQKEKPIFDDISLTSQVSSNIFAGSDSTAISLSAMLLYLLKNPEKKKILLAEIEAMAQKKNVKQCGIFSLEMANDMPYLQAVMWEAMRLHPAIGMNIGRRVPQGGVTIDGRYYPEGTTLSMNAWVINRDKKTFGEDSDAFRPERWMEDSERVGDMKRIFFSFGAGARFCLGRHIAWLEMSKLIPSLFHSFDIDLATPDLQVTEHTMSKPVEAQEKNHSSRRSPLLLNYQPDHRDTMSSVVEHSQAKSPTQDSAAHSQTSTINPGTELDEKRAEDSTEPVAADSQPSDEEAAPPPPTDTPEPPPNGGTQAWLTVLGAHFLFCNSWGIANAFGTFQTYYELELLQSSSPSDIAWIGSVQSWLLLFVGALSGPIYDAGYARALIIGGSFFSVFGQMMLSLCDNYWQIFLAQGICVGIGGGMLCMIGNLIASQYFTTKLSTATGIAAAGSSLGGVIYPIVFHRLQPTVGFGWATRVIGFITLALQLVAILVLKPRVKPQARRGLLDLAAFKEVPYTVFTFSVFVGFLGLYQPFFYVQSFAIKTGLTNSNLGFYLLSILNATSAFGRILPGMVSDKIGAMNAMIPCAFLSALLAFCILAVKDAAGIIVLMVLYGFFSGTFVSSPTATIIRLSAHNRAMTGTRLGQAFAIISFGYLIGTPVGGVVLDQHGFNALWIFTGAIIVGSSLILMLARYFYKGLSLTAIG
ncbi:uncharacterized protein TRUGW13939_06803 [Talaromyces rugulosus]|uniref:Major facilitator superfamily (MFS) profile domain-containing protein n=1 Tax=Talaromyces rugulosus TaxID=121627 RepID=A0A7H8R446_TALRU|nr:uncharacterized protein TRUGW13939_06803 [Talaromyces rugulosus]QKX59663.1 hypothetical protein TRUGW13939_06803 [Talaromyces rugulosus]